MKNDITNHKRYEQLLKEFHPNKNGDLKLSDLTSGSGKKVWWKCPVDDDHEWIAAIRHRINGTGCSCCFGRVVVLSNQLSTTHPELIKEWHPTKNKNLTPYNVTVGFKNKIWWKCDIDDDHEWESTIINRANGRKCPYCSGKKASKSNCLAILNPEISQQWHPTKNEYLTPRDVTSKSGKKVWWKCDKGHSWKTTIAHRTRRNGSNCPECNESKGEIAVRKFLIKNNIKFENQKRFKDCKDKRTLPFDFYLTDYNLLIEYDGTFHYEPTGFVGGTKKLKETQNRDKIKTEYAKNNNINLLRIPYTEFDNIEHIILKNISKLQFQI